LSNLVFILLLAVLIITWPHQTKLHLWFKCHHLQRDLIQVKVQLHLIKTYLSKHDIFPAIIFLHAFHQISTHISFSQVFYHTIDIFLKEHNVKEVVPKDQRQV